MKTGPTALKRVKVYFPQVTKVVDAKKSILISVIEQDNISAKAKDPTQCALAQACKRTKIADGAIINLSFSYLIKGNIATRYRTSETVAREVVSFDRHNDFSAGRNYRLSLVGKSSRLNRKRHNYPANGSRKQRGLKIEIVHRHRTDRIRKLVAV